MNLYVLPASELGFEDKIFEQSPYESRGGFSNFQYWYWLKRAAEKRGITVHTTDFWSKEKSGPDDILLVQNHPGETFLWRMLYLLKYPKTRGGFTLARQRFFYENYKLFKKRVLWHAESPMATPYVYKRIDSIWESGMYHKIILLGRDAHNRYTHLNYNSIREYNLTSPYFNEPKEKFLVMVNSNTAPHSLGDELYGERLRAFRYFCDKDKLDLYGYRWNETPRHPFYFHYKKYVAKIWRGTVEDKLKMLSVYKFSLCFENCSHPGYISEKIFDCLAVGCIPVYLGAPDIASVVPESCFIDFKKFENYDELYSHLESLTAADLENYRNSILTFLQDKSSMRGMASLVDEILA